jgi:pyruvate,water dikinase
MGLVALMLATQQTPLDQADAALWGGKGAGLIRLAAWGVDVPPFFVLGADVYRAGAGPALLDAIRTGLRGLPPGPLAVRSSALDEDGGESSLAGQLETFLNVPPDAEAVAERVVACWQSLHNERSRAYRQLRGLQTDDLAMAVVVQVLLPAERSLVVFSSNPTGAPDEVLASAAWGLGDGLVSGAVDGDTDVLGAEGKLLRHTPGEQAELSVSSADGNGVALQALDEARKGKPVLEPGDHKVVWQLAMTVAERFGRPVDIEAAFVGDRLYCLQARPITTAKAGGRKLLWDNSNVVESYSGVTTPLTFSHASNAYRIVYTLFGRMLGVPREVHEANERAMQTYIGLLNGRVYYNLLHWYLSMAHLPGYGFTRGAMENMMGVREALDVELPQAGSPLQKWTSDFPRLAAMVGRTLWSFARIDWYVKRFEANFEQIYGRYRGETFEGWDAERLIGLYHELLYKLLHKWEAPILTDVGAMVCMSAFQKLAARWIPQEPGLASELLVGEGAIESTQPARRLQAIAESLRGRTAALDGEPGEFYAALKRDPALADVALALADWLERYGDRSMNELKLEEPSLRERPAFVVALLRNYLAAPPQDAAAVEAREKAQRQAAEAKLDASLGGLKAIVLKKVLAWTRMHVRNRENMRFARTRLTGLMRRMFVLVGKDLTERGALRGPDDVFYLTIDELTAYVDGRSVTRDLGALAALRRAEFEAFKAIEPPDRFVTHGLPHLHVPTQAAEAAGDGVLVGTPCCAGVVEAATRLIRDPNSDLTLRGEILVAPRTDPGWVALYPSASGLLVEKGSVLSHSAIVARELGLPTIVGVKGLCARLNDGQRVRMDGASGQIEVLEGGDGA